MFIFKIQPTTKSKKWIKDNKINIRALEEALSIVYNCEYKKAPVSNMRIWTLKLVIFEHTSMGFYEWDTDILEIGIKSKSKKGVMYNLFANILHESRHWHQCTIRKVKEEWLDYSDVDVEKMTDKYYKNKYEIDARSFETKYLETMTKLYQELEKVYRV